MEVLKRLKEEQKRLSDTQRPGPYQNLRHCGQRLTVDTRYEPKAGRLSGRDVGPGTAVTTRSIRVGYPPGAG